MNYELLRSPQALRQLRHLHRTHSSQIHQSTAAITALSNDLRPAKATRLVNRPEWRIRIGDYRILYQIDDRNRTVTIMTVRHRRDVYK